MTRTLILIPTRRECKVLQPRLEPSLGPADRVELCGFGLAAAAARSSQLIERVHPDRVILVGIAGTYCDDLPVGSATLFDTVACYGIGAGSGFDHQTLGDMGWYHVGGQRSDASIEDITISDTITLGAASPMNDIAPCCQLLSVAAASGTSDEAAFRRRRFPAAAAEDMEGFAVALACQLTDVPLAIVRGMSNQAGDRDVANWQIKPALEAAADLAVQLVISGRSVSHEDP